MRVVWRLGCPIFVSYRSPENASLLLNQTCIPSNLPWDSMKRERKKETELAHKISLILVFKVTIFYPNNMYWVETCNSISNLARLLCPWQRIKFEKIYNSKILGFELQVYCISKYWKISYLVPKFQFEKLFKNQLNSLVNRKKLSFEFNHVLNTSPFENLSWKCTKFIDFY